jgi:hypothetical protein
MVTKALFRGRSLGMVIAITTVWIGAHSPSRATRPKRTPYRPRAAQNHPTRPHPRTRAKQNPLANLVVLLAGWGTGLS